MMAIHEHLTRIPKRELKQAGRTKAAKLVEIAKAGCSDSFSPKDGQGRPALTE